MKHLALILALAACATDQPPAPGHGPQCNDGQAGKCDGAGGSTDPFKGLEGVENREFEYIVVGSGAGGGPLAANLARAGHSVLLLEAGKETGGKTESQVPAFHPTATETPDLAWWYFVDHYSDHARASKDSKITDEGILYPRGGTLGGSTAVNALITVAPKNSDWDGIASLTGDESWRATSMHKYYDTVTRWLSTERPQLPADALLDGSLMAILTSAFRVSGELGLGGPNGLSSNPLANVFTIFGFLKRDINTETMAGRAQGVFQFPLASKHHVRNGTREYLLATARDARRFPLRIKTQALVTKVDFADAADEHGNWKATGVEFLDGASLYAADLTSGQGAEPRTVHVRATREVILSAGAFNTPQLLMLSGIGDRQELAQHGIDVKVDLPGVGKNLQDRYEVGVVTEVSDDFRALERCNYNGDASDPCFRDWQRGRGAYTSNGGVVSILAKSSPNKAEADLHIFGIPGTFKGYKPGYSVEANSDKNHFTWLILKGHTDNRGGTVKLRSANPRERPQINFHYFDDGDVDQGQDVNDLTAVVNGVEIVRKITTKADQLDLFTSHEEVWPGSATNDRAKVGEWIKREAWGHHASCSAPIGADGDAKAVLDSKFRVRGTNGLRVVDASVFPRIPGTFIVLPIYMVSEKATDTILESLGETRNPAMFP